MLRTILSMLAAVLAAAACGGGPDESERDRAAAAAQDAYAEAKAEGMDFEAGPCLGVVLEGWVADVAHDPLRDVDDLPENQCEAFRSGEADHFVELDLEGRVIRVE
jgi:ABC-type glycerol-3-phosphate transport system substrate-binding protein